MDSVRPVDVLYFLAEVAVYVSVGWWGATRGLPVIGRVLLAAGIVGAFAVAWGLLAAPAAGHPLTGWADTLFRVGWFALGAVALAAVLLR